MRFLIVLMILLTGCNHLTVERGEAVSLDGPKHEYKLTSFVWGLFNGSEIPTPLCQSGNFKQIHFYMSAGDTALTALTLGLYVPHRAAVTCAP